MCTCVKSPWLMACVTTSITWTSRILWCSDIMSLISWLDIITLWSMVIVITLTTIMIIRMTTSMTTSIIMSKITVLAKMATTTTTSPSMNILPRFMSISSTYFWKCYWICWTALMIFLSIAHFLFNNKEKHIKFLILFDAWKVERVFSNIMALETSSPQKLSCEHILNKEEL